MTENETIDAVADVIWEHTFPGFAVRAAEALHAAGWLRTAEDRAVIDAADALTEWYDNRPATTPMSQFYALEMALIFAVRARRVAAGGTEVKS